MTVLQFHRVGADNILRTTKATAPDPMPAWLRCAGRLALEIVNGVVIGLALGLAVAMTVLGLIETVAP